MIRWWSLALTVVVAGCTGEPVDTGDDTDPDSDTDSETTDTDIDDKPVWADRKVQTAATLYGVYTGGTGAFVAGTDGVMWQLTSGAASPILTGTLEDLQGLWGRGDELSTELIAVGTSGTVLNYLAADGSITPEDVGTPAFNDIDGDRDDLTAVGWGGAYRYTGGSWLFETLPKSYRLNSVWVGTSITFAVGDDGVIARRVSNKWEEDPITGLYTQNFNGVFGLADDNVWVVGQEGTVLHWDGTSWTQINVNQTVTLWGVWGDTTSGKVFIVGNSGIALTGDVAGFKKLPTGTDANLYGVYGTSDENVWAVGNRGQILRYNGG